MLSWDATDFNLRNSREGLNSYESTNNMYTTSFLMRAASVAPYANTVVKFALLVLSLTSFSKRAFAAKWMNILQHMSFSYTELLKNLTSCNYSSSTMSVVSQYGHPLKPIK